MKYSTNRGRILANFFEQYLAQMVCLRQFFQRQQNLERDSVMLTYACLPFRAIKNLIPVYRSRID